MKKFIFATLLPFAAALAQQAPTPADFATSIKNQYNSNKGFILASAEKMPDEAYGWRPAGLEAELRTFGQILAHIANENNQTCSRLNGQATPKPLDDAKGTFTKPEATKFLKDAFALCDPLYNALTNQSMAEIVKLPGRNNTTREQPRGTSMVANLSHSNEQYGMIMVYFGMKGLVPPSHARGGGR
ncbi:MAG: DinB family protein [Acidobacteriota bacterium]|nr:DinB family protein [Acidobacteriota bacterium]